MDFDLSQIAVPFRMQPGLARLPDGSRQLHALAPGSALAREKQAVVDAGASRLRVPGFDPEPALAAIVRQALANGIDPALLESQPLELAIEEDLAILDGRTGTLPWLCVCAPSHWAPEDKLGLDFLSVHAPVADARLMLAASHKLVALATSGQRWERFVWTISPSSRHDQHPRRAPPRQWPDTADPASFAQGCWLRTERQTFFPVGGDTGQAVFTIRVQLTPLVEAMADPVHARRLHDSLVSMSPQVLAYKGLAPAVPRLLPWLLQHSGS